MEKAIFLIALLSQSLLVSTYSIAKGVALYGFGGSTFGAICTSKSVREAFIKYNQGDEDAMEDLLLNVANLALCNVGGMAATSVFPKLGEIVAKKVLTRTSGAITAYNAKLAEDATDIIHTAKRPSVKITDLTNKFTTSDLELKAMKETGLENFKADLRRIKVDNKVLYKTIKQQTKWLRLGGKVLKVSGPLFDVVSIVINAYTLHNSEPGTNKHTSAAIGLAAGVVGVLGFLAGLALIAFPPGVLVAGIVTGGIYAATVASVTLGISSAVVGQIPDDDGEDVSELEADISVGRFSGINAFNEKIEEYPRNITKFLDKMQQYKWEYVYVMSQPNLVKWEDTNNNVEIGGQNGKLQFGSRDPMDDKKDDDDLECLPYKGTLNVNGRKQTASRKVNPSCSNPEAAKTVGFDFVGLKNHFIGRDPSFQGYSVFCLTDAVKDASVQYRGLKIRTETNRTPQNHKNGDDFVLLDDMEKLNQETIKIRTGGGNDVLSITGYLTERRSLTPVTRNTLDAKLGTGYDVLSFAAMPKRFGTTGNPIVRDHQRLFSGVNYEVQSGILKYIYLTSAGKYRQEVGKVRGVNLFDCSPFNDEILLDTNTKHNDVGIEDFGIMNQAGKNTYALNVVDNERNGHIRKYIIFDRSSSKPVISIVNENSNNKNIVAFERDKILVVYCKVNNKVRVFAHIVLLELVDRFDLKFNHELVDIDSLGVTYVDGNVVVYNVCGNTEPAGFTSKKDQLILTCQRSSDLSGDDVQLNLGGGSIVIGKDFFNNCEIEPEVEGEVYEEDDEDSSSITLSKEGRKHLITITKSSRVNKKIFLEGTDKIIDDHGTTIVDLTQSLNGRTVDLLQKYSDSFGFDVEAIEKGLMFTGASGFTLHPTAPQSSTFSLEIQFKPGKYGIVMFASNNNQQIELVLLENGKVAFVDTQLSASYAIRLPGNIIWDGWNTIKAEVNHQNLKAKLNNNEYFNGHWSASRISDWIFQNLHLGYYNIRTPIGDDTVKNVKQGFAGEIVKLLFNNEELGFKGKDVTYDHVAQYNEERIEFPVLEKKHQKKHA